MPNFELAAIAYITWILLYDFSYEGSTYRPGPITGVKCLEDYGRYSFKVKTKVTWQHIDFLDDWNHYHIFHDGEMRQDQFYIFHSYNKNDKITFKLHSYRYFEIENSYGQRLTAELDPSNNDKVIIKAQDHTKARWTYEFH